jgi:hypothetical protein
MLTEDTRVSTFERTKDFYGLQSGATPQALYPAYVSIFGSDEHLQRAWSGAENERAAIIEYDGSIPRAWAEASSGSIAPARPPICWWGDGSIHQRCGPVSR